jgi:hypothetical protein
VTRSVAYRHPAWFDRPVNRLRLVSELQRVADGVTVVRPSKQRRSGFAVRFTLTPTGLKPQPVTVEFSANRALRR